jgi:hypothetical protein
VQERRAGGGEQAPGPWEDAVGLGQIAQTFLNGPRMHGPTCIIYFGNEKDYRWPGGDGRGVDGQTRWWGRHRAMVTDRWWNRGPTMVDSGGDGVEEEGRAGPMTLGAWVNLKLGVSIFFFSRHIKPLGEYDVAEN